MGGEFFKGTVARKPKLMIVDKNNSRDSNNGKTESKMKVSYADMAKKNMKGNMHTLGTHNLCNSVNSNVVLTKLG